MIIRCIKTVEGAFTEGLEYNAEWKIKNQLSAIDDFKFNHVIAEVDMKDKWFKRHFEIIKK